MKFDGTYGKRGRKQSNVRDRISQTWRTVGLKHGIENQPAQSSHWKSPQQPSWSSCRSSMVIIQWLVSYESRWRTDNAAKRAERDPRCEYYLPSPLISNMAKASLRSATSSSVKSLSAMVLLLNFQITMPVVCLLRLLRALSRGSTLSRCELSKRTDWRAHAWGVWVWRCMWCVWCERTGTVGTSARMTLIRTILNRLLSNQ
jgi:hypothetical protein